MRRGRVDLTDPATTLALLNLDAVVGVRGFFDDGGQRLQTVGITCAWSSTTINSSRVEPYEVLVGPRDTFSYRNKLHRAT